MNKTQLRKECSRILNFYRIGGVVTKVKDFDFLIKVFSSHTEWTQKKGSGIDFISVDKSLGMYGGRCFYITRSDGSKTDISFTHSIKAVTPIQEIIKACRSSVNGEIKEFKKGFRNNKTRCEVTNEVLSSHNTHVDHYNKTFKEVFELWIKGKDLKILKSKINKSFDMSFDTYFTDESIVNDFILFHNQNTNLRFVSKKANLSILKTNK